MPTNPSRYLNGVLLPGAVASAPWMLLIQENFGGVSDGVLGVAAFVTAAVVGGVFEIRASASESQWDHAHPDGPRLMDDWYRYLCKLSDKKAVAFGFISHMVDGLYFELSMSLALPVTACGLVLLCLEKQAPWPCIPASAVIALGRWWFRQEAKITHEALYVARRELASRNPADGGKQAEASASADAPG